MPEEITHLKKKIVLSKAGTDAFAKSGDKFRKDFIREGSWVLPNGEKFPVTRDRMVTWEKSFKLFRERGISVPLTVDHIEVQKPGTNEMTVKRLTPGMADAKRGDVVNIFVEGSVGMFDAVPADKEAEVLMGRCPEVSLEVTENFNDAHGNYYDQAITAITLTPVPVIPGQQGWKKIAASREVSGDTVYLSAERDTATQRPAAVQENNAMLTPEQIARARQTMGLPATTPDTEVMVIMLSRVESQGATITEQTNKITQLSRAADAGAALVIDEDAAEMVASTLKGRIENLTGYTPAQKTTLLSIICGATGKRPSVCLSRKAATAVGLSEPLGDAILKVLESVNGAEMLKLLGEKSGAQRKTVLSKDGVTEDAKEFDPEVQKQMIAACNGAASPNQTVL